ncbi:MAG: prepilin-type N-terminal cleavage/methylation domain-containing protein [bacterium]
MIKKGLKGSFGFTLIEILVTISIMGILTSLMAVNFSVGKKAGEVRNEALLLTQAIRELQTRAISGELINSVDYPSSYFFEVQGCSIGCDSYILNAGLNSGATSTPKMVRLNNIRIVFADDKMHKLEFLTPRGYATSTDFLEQEMIIKVQHKDDAGITKNIVINKISGRVDVK